MKVYQDIIEDYAIGRIADAFKRYSPKNISFVDSEDKADFVILYAHGQRRKVWWKASRLIKENKDYAVVQLCLKSTTNPSVSDWLPIWNGAKIVWSYYNLSNLCWNNQISYDFNFYHAPLGVDSTLFEDLGRERVYKILTGTHRKESLDETREALKKVGGIGITPNKLSDQALVLMYNECEYVSGLRKIEGFEMPVIEGLLCGARPICFDRKHYRNYFGDLVEYIPETDSEIVKNLVKIFKKKPRPVTDEEKELVKVKFSWENIIKGFWKKL